jgi:small subunit ribosomal protein S20
VAHSLSAKKRIRQNAKHRALNRARKGQVKSALRTFRETAATGDQPKTAEALRAAIKKVDQVAAKGTINKNTAARRKSLLQRQFNALQAK